MWTFSIHVHPHHLIATDDKKKIKCLNVVLNNKTEPLHVVLEFNWCRDTLHGDQSLPLIGHESVCKRQRKNIPRPTPPPLPRFQCLFRARTSDLAREIWLPKLILPKNKRCNIFAHVSFSVVDRRCPTPEIPANGRVRGKNTTFGSVIKYRCSSSYKLQGPKTRTCRGNGKWDGETPICS